MSTTLTASWIDGGRHAAVIGQQWGDEGKGKVVDLLTPHFDVIVRFNGGANAGHTVVVGDVRHALHLVPCGILHPGKINVIGNGVVVDPEVLGPEIDALVAAGVPVGDNLRISERAHVVFPHHKRADALYEAAVAASAGEERRIGTTGRGIGPTYADKALRTTAIRVADLLDDDYCTAKLRHIARVKNAMLGGLAEMAGQPFEPLDPDGLVETARAYAARLRPFVADTGRLVGEALADGRRLLFEGGNGTLLDVDHGTYPYVTSSHTSALGIYPGAAVPGGHVGEVVGIMKAYTTRVGAGPCPTEQENEIGARLRDRGNEFGTTTGRPRRCGWLDLVAVRHSVRLSGTTRLAVTLLDVLAGLDTLRVCTGYRVGGAVTDAFPAAVTALEAAEPVYEELPGFAEEITGCRRADDLPAAASAYLERIEEIVGVPVSVVSVGPERSQTLMRP